MSYLLLFHWSFSFGASELVCTVVILFALLLAPVRMESITGRMCVREAKSECVTLIKVQFVTRFCYRATTQSVLSLK